MCVFYLLRFGYPMTKYETMKGVLEHVGLQKVPKKHWLDNVGWKMAEAIYNVVQDKMREVVRGAS